MKVSDLFETDEWANNKIRRIFENDEWQNVPVSLSYLYKKQISACHQFGIELDKLFKADPDNEFLQNWKEAWFHPWDKSDPPHHEAPANTMAENGFNDYPSLSIRWENILKAKRNYERAGGRYL